MTVPELVVIVFFVAVLWVLLPRIGSAIGKLLGRFFSGYVFRKFYNRVRKSY